MSGLKKTSSKLNLPLTNADKYGIMVVLNERKNNMTKNEAKLELFKTDRQIEKKIIEHANELGQHNKNCVEQELQLLWDRKDILKNIINS